VRWIKLGLTGFFLAIAGTVPSLACTFTVTPASFGELDMSVSSTLDTVADINVTCPRGVVYQIKVDSGLHSREDFHTRKMLSPPGDAGLAYNLYRNPARTEVLGDGIGNTFTLSGIGKGRPEIIRIYGRIAGHQNVRADLYADALSLTLEW
jgi:spore coat protein U-like protein